MTRITTPKGCIVETIDGAIRIHLPLFRSGGYLRESDRPISEYSIIADQQPDKKWTIKITNPTTEYQKVIQTNINSSILNEFIKLFGVTATLEEFIESFGFAPTLHKFKSLEDYAKGIITPFDNENISLSISELEEKLKSLKVRDSQMPWNNWNLWSGYPLDRRAVEYMLFDKKRELLDEGCGAGYSAERLKSQIDKLSHVLESQITKYKSLRKEIEAMPQYKIWREAVIKKFGRKCSVCGSTENIEVDHRFKSFYAIVRENRITDIVKAYECAELWNVDNGAPLCKKHHDQTKSSVYYSMKNQEV